MASPLASLSGPSASVSSLDFDSTEYDSFSFNQPIQHAPEHQPLPTQPSRPGSPGYEARKRSYYNAELDPTYWYCLPADGIPLEYQEPEPEPNFPPLPVFPPQRASDKGEAMALQAARDRAAKEKKDAEEAATNALRKAKITRNTASISAGFDDFWEKNSSLFAQPDGDEEVIVVDDDEEEESDDLDLNYWPTSRGSSVPAVGDSEEDEAATVGPAPEEEQQQVHQSSLVGDEDCWVEGEEVEEDDEADEDYEDDSVLDPVAASIQAQEWQEDEEEAEDDDGDDGDDDEDDDYLAPSSRRTRRQTRRQPQQRASTRQAGSTTTSQPLPTTTLQPSSSASTQSVNSTRKASSWSEDEVAAAIKIMLEIKSSPQYASILKTERRFDEISRRMGAEYGFARSPAAVKFYWSRYIRQSSGIEDRSEKRHIGSGMVTSSLKKQRTSNSSATSSQPNNSGQPSAPAATLNSLASTSTTLGGGKSKQRAVEPDAEDDDDEDSDDIPLARKRGTKRPRDEDDDEDFNPTKRPKVYTSMQARPGTQQRQLGLTRPPKRHREDTEDDSVLPITKRLRNDNGNVSPRRRYDSGDRTARLTTLTNNDDDDDDEEVVSSASRAARSRLARQAAAQAVEVEAEEDQDEQDDQSEQVDPAEQMRRDAEYARQLQVDLNGYGNGVRSRRGRGFR